MKNKRSKNTYWRKHWVRFWFPSSVTNLDDYWNLQPGSRFVVKSYYTTGAKAKLPNPKDFLKFDNVDVNQFFLTSSTAREMNPVVQKKMTKAFPAEVAQAAAQKASNS